MSSNYRAQVEEAVRAVAFHSPTTYSWFGNRSRQLSPTVKRALTTESRRRYLLSSLQLRLYNDFYCQGAAIPVVQEAIASSKADISPFVKELSAAKFGSGYRDDGWEISATEDNHVVLRKGDLQLWVGPEECLIPQGTPVVPGMQVGLRFSKELMSRTPGFYMALSDEEFSPEEPQSIVRLYWNLTPEGAVRFLQSATSMLNRAHLSFNLKVLNDPTRYTRCDSVVLYVRKSDYAAASDFLESIYPEVALDLGQRTPVFTKSLAAGVGLAEDPRQPESFGQNRCRLLADGIIRAYEQGKESVDERLQTVINRFAEDGIAPEKPFLNPGSVDDYTFQPRVQHPSSVSHGATMAPHAILARDDFLKAAKGIGQRLSKEVVWHRNLCNWVGAQDTASQSGGTYKALGPELYSGTSGVALFLAELHAATGDVSARCTALGGLRHALSYVDAVPPLVRLGLYTGWVGIAFAAARVGTLLGQEELLERAAQLLQRTMHDLQEKHELDLLSGNAGAIVGLVTLRHAIEDPSLLEFAVRLGDELLETAQKSEVGYSWRRSGNPKGRNLTGFSHGTAGVGHALLELSQATGDSEYRLAAEKAFEYERHWFDVERGNWPDFREESAQGKRGQRPLSFKTYWCHGAPGIALSRLRAYEALDDKTCEAEATAALQATRRAVELELYSGVGNYSLCHGLAGNAEVLLLGHGALGEELTDDPSLAFEVACNGITRYATSGHMWPCGTSGGETPGLMLGLAGTGYFYLRLHNPAIPSVLMVPRKA
jgi:hypothetical protein